MPNSSFPRWTQSGSWVAKELHKASLFSLQGIYFQLISLHSSCIESGVCVILLGCECQFCHFLELYLAFSQLPGDFCVLICIFVSSYFILSIHKQALLYPHLTIPVCLELPYFVSADSWSWCLLLCTTQFFSRPGSYLLEFYLKEFSKAQAEETSSREEFMFVTNQVLRGTHTCSFSACCFQDLSKSIN